MLLVSQLVLLITLNKHLSQNMNNTAMTAWINHFVKFEVGSNKSIPLKEIRN